MTKGKAQGCIDLLGSPNLYDGKSIYFTFDRKAEVEVRDNSELSIEHKDNNGKLANFDFAQKLVKESVVELGLQDRKFKLTFQNDIPHGYGFGENTALTVATIKTLDKHFKLGWNPERIAEYAHKVTNRMMDSPNSAAESYAISFEGLNFIDLSRRNISDVVKSVDGSSVPCYICCRPEPGSPDKKILSALKYDSLDDLSEQGVYDLKRNDWRSFGKKMKKEVIFRGKVDPYFSEDLEMMRTFVDHHVRGARVMGKGGAIIVLDEEGSRFNMVAEESEYTFFRPKIVYG